MSNRFEAVRKRVRGPVYPVPPAFTEAGDFDPEGVADYVRYLCGQGAKLVMVTAGTSRLNLLTQEEVEALNRTVAQAASDDALVIGATPPYGSASFAADVTRKAMADGCDCVLLYYPERHYDDETVFRYYSRIAEETDAPLMIHGAPMEGGRGQGSVPYSMDLCRRLAGLDNIVGMKEEFGNEELRYKLAAHLGERIPLIVAGASMRKHLGSTLYGVQSWLVGVGSFVPSVEEEFFRLMEAGEQVEALRLVVDVEEPLFNEAMPMGWHVAMRAMLDILDLMPGHEREPMPEASQEHRESLKKLAVRLGWL